MIDILYLAKGRPEFTRASLGALVQNSNWDVVDKLCIYTDGAPDPRGVPDLGDMPFEFHREVVGGPVAILNDFVAKSGAELFAKIDNDVIVPPGWLDAAAAVMEQHPMLDFLGIEPPASRTANPSTRRREVVTPENGHAACSTHLCHYSQFPQHAASCFAPAAAVGGVGLFRRSAFAGRPPMIPHAFNGVGGFTGWQLQHNELMKGWIVPPLKLFLLDRLPFEPWASLSKKYIAEGIQRPWTNYDPADRDALWGWWQDEATR